MQQAKETSGELRQQVVSMEMHHCYQQDSNSSTDGNRELDIPSTRVSEPQ